MCEACLRVEGGHFQNLLEHVSYIMYVCVCVYIYIERERVYEEVQGLSLLCV